MSLHIQICGTVSSGGARLLLALDIKQIALSLSGDSGQSSIFRLTQMLNVFLVCSQRFGLDVFFWSFQSNSVLQNLSGFCCISAYSYSAFNLTQGDRSVGFCCIPVILVSERPGGCYAVRDDSQFFKMMTGKKLGMLKEAKKYWQPFLGQKIRSWSFGISETSVLF